MGVMPLPRTSTLYLMRVPLDAPDVDLQVGLGRLHSSKSEILKRIKEKKMAIVFANKSVLPVVTRGKAATEASIAISEMGRMVFNKLASDNLKAMGAFKVLIARDDASGKVVIWPVAKDAKEAPFKQSLDVCFDLNFGKDGGGKSGIAINNSAPQLRAWDYRFKDAGNQTYPIKAGLVNKVVALTFDLAVGDKTPAAKPKADRKPRTPKVAKTMAAAVGASVPQTAAGSEDELVME